MQKAIIGKKVGMTQIFDENGHVIPVTVIEAGPCVVAQKKTIENDGYNAVQLAWDVGNQADQAGARPSEKAEHALRSTSRSSAWKGRRDECRRRDKASVFARRQVDVTGISKGHGYEGPVKRWQHRTPMTHGGGPVHRQAGSMGSSSDPSRIFKGKIGAGQMGVEQVTVQNLDVVKVDADLNMLVIRGAIPGPKGGLVYVKSTVKKIKETHGEAGVSKNPQKASARNPQKASARG
ncbi:MAG: 50S ribosomal protein L3 [Oscillospiraceae bacterium]